jgi:hypothetical protein
MAENRFQIMLPEGQECLYQESMQWQQNLFAKIKEKRTYLVKIKYLQD